MTRREEIRAHAILGVGWIGLAAYVAGTVMVVTGWGDPWTAFWLFVAGLSVYGCVRAWSRWLRLVLEYRGRRDTR